VLFNTGVVDLEEPFVGTWTVNEEDIEWAMQSEGESGYILGKPSDYLTEQRERSHMFMRTSTLPAGFQASWPFAMTREDMDLLTAPLIWDETVWNLSYTRCTSNDNDLIQPYHVYSWYAGWIVDSVANPHWEKINIIDMLSNDKCFLPGVWGTTELDETLIGIEFFDRTEKAVVGKAISWGVAWSVETWVYTNPETPPTTETTTTTQDPLSVLLWGDRIVYGGLL
jgi:hypothetical protein